jgi:hypothetical protein
MMTYNFGDILLIRFPFTDQSRMSKRPVLVLYDERGHGYTALQGDNQAMLLSC